MSDLRWLERPDGVRLAWERHGPGHPRLAVVTHGLFCHRGLPELVVLKDALLAAGFDVVLWDVRGHGDSDGRFDFGRKSGEDLRALVEVVRAEARPQTLAALGFSFGAYHVMRAQIGGARFDRLVLVSGPKDYGGIAGAMLGGHIGDTMRLRRQRPLRPVRFGLPRRLRPPGVELAARLGVPTLFVHGTRDWLVPLAHSEALHAAAPPPKRLVVLEGGLHAEYLLAQGPEAFLGTVVPWLCDPS